MRMIAAGLAASGSGARQREGDEVELSQDKRKGVEGRWVRPRGLRDADPGTGGGHWLVVLSHA